MKGLLALLLIAFTAVSCADSDTMFVELDPSVINKHLKDRTDIDDPEELMKIYYGEVETSEGSSIDVKVRHKAMHRYEIILVHDGLLDDSVKAVKIVMDARQKNQKWKVMHIRKNWQCREGRGHTDWGVDLCK